MGRGKEPDKPKEALWRKFRDGIAGFRGPKSRTPQRSRDRGEQRWHAIGGVRKAVLLVVHVYVKEKPNGEETIRIISAGEASPRERRVYLEQAAD